MKELTQKKRRISHSSDEAKSLILYNDDVNLFDFVVESLVDICEHSPEQAEQCTIIAHYNGSCEIKCGTYNELNPCHKKLTKKKLTVCIE